MSHIATTDQGKYAASQLLKLQDSRLENADKALVSISQSLLLAGSVEDMIKTRLWDLFLHSGVYVGSCSACCCMMSTRPIIQIELHLCSMNVQASRISGLICPGCSVSLVTR